MVRANNSKGVDIPLLTIILILVCIGLVALASSSSYAAISLYSDSNYFLKRQLLFAIVGVISMLLISKYIDYSNYERFAYLRLYIWNTFNVCCSNTRSRCYCKWCKEMAWSTEYLDFSHQRL